MKLPIGWKKKQIFINTDNYGAVRCDGLKVGWTSWRANWHIMNAASLAFAAPTRKDGLSGEPLTSEQILEWCDRNIGPGE